MIDDAATVAAGWWALAAPAQVVERAALDAQQRGGLVDGEKGRVVVILEHEGGLRSFRVASVSDIRGVRE
jgi:hypothetical protein